MIQIVTGALGTVAKSLKKGPERFGNPRMYREHPNCCIVKIGQNTEKSLGDPRKIAVTQPPIKRHHLMLV